MTRGDALRDGTERGPNAGGDGATDDASDVEGAEQAGRDADEEGVTTDVLRAQVDVLEEENDRLREEYVRARRSEYRRTALALAAVGLVALGGAALFPEYREVLLALAGTGLFAGTITYYLTPERFVSASVAERVHRAHVANQRALLEDLGLQDQRVYVPTPSKTEPARLFVPQRRNYEAPSGPEHLLVVANEASARGVAFVPTGATLYDAFEQTATDGPADSPDRLAAQLADAVVETFELAEAAGTDADESGDRIVLTVAEPVFGSLDAPDHPVVSVVATGLAVELDEPVTASVEQTGPECRVVFEWGASPAAEPGPL